MSSRYPKEVTAALKSVLRCRRDNNYYRFTEEDIAELTAKTGLTRPEVIEWAHNVRGYYPTPESIEKFFERTETEPNKYIIHCHVIAWNMSSSSVQTLWDSNKFTFIAAGVSEGSGVAEMFVSFKQRTYTHAFKTQLEELLGASEIQLNTSENDGGKFAAAALLSVQKMGKKDGCIGLSFGECSKNIAARAEQNRVEEEKAAAEEGRMFDAKTAEAVRMSMNDLKEGQAALKQDVTQISERMVCHDDIDELRLDSIGAIRELRSDSVDVFRDMEKRLEQSQNTTKELQEALKQAQSSDALKSQHLTEEQGKNKRQAVMLAKLNQENDAKAAKINTMEGEKKKLELEVTKLKTTLSGVQNTQIMLKDIRGIKTLLEKQSGQLGGQMEGMGAKLAEQMGATLGEQLGAKLGEQLEGMGAKMAQQLGAKLGEQLGAKLGEQLQGMGAKLDGKLGAQLGEQLQGMGAKLAEQLDAKLVEQLDAKLDGLVEKQNELLERMQAQVKTLMDTTYRIELMHSVAFTTPNTYIAAAASVANTEKDEEGVASRKRQHSQMMEQEHDSADN